MDPRIILGMDNCFAAKRWIRPKEWMKLIRDMGLFFVEASADTECDPLYMGDEFTSDWILDVQKCSKETGVAVKNVYSGHGTYVTRGISHYDDRIIARFRDQWMKKQMDTAQALGAGFGFFAHGFEELLLQDAEKYAKKLEGLYDTLAELAQYAAQIGLSSIGIEQMYSPHQPPWTIEGAKTLLKEVHRRSGQPFYITVDLGHMNGQQYFARPSEAYIREKIALAKSGKPAKRVWVGSRKAHEYYVQAIEGRISLDEAVRSILEDIEQNPQLFSQPQDWDIYHWIRELGCYSPIMHLQQSDGKSSPHWPFSEEYNQKGVVKAEEVIRALATAYEAPEDDQMPPKCDEIVLTFEPFISTAGNVYDLVDELKESVAYWRKWIPEDGMRLSKIVERL